MDYGTHYHLDDADQKGKQDRAMHIHPHSKRRIRIVGKPDDTRGYTLQVYDAETGEKINNVRGVTLYLHVERANTALVSYYETNEQGKFLVDKWNGPIESTLTLASPEVDVTAFELPSEEGKET